jgi:hypothetical protein
MIAGADWDDRGRFPQALVPEIPAPGLRTLRNLSLNREPSRKGSSIALSGLAARAVFRCNLRHTRQLRLLASVVVQAILTIASRKIHFWRGLSNARMRGLALDRIIGQLIFSLQSR